MSYTLTTAFPPTILKDAEDCNVSLYMPTHRTAPDNKQDALRFKNMLSVLEEKLGDKKDMFMPRLRELEMDLNFWIYNLDGLVILMNSKDMTVYRLPRTVAESISVSDGFYLKPLLRNYQSDHRYYVLSLNKKHFELYSGNRYGFRPVELPEDVHTELADVLGHDYTDNRLNVVSQGGVVGNFHGHGSRKDEMDIDTQRFFNYVDKETTKLCARTGIPLILVALPENQGLFRSPSKNKWLLDNGIDTSFDSLTYDNLKRSFWTVVEPIYLKKTEDLLDAYHAGQHNQKSLNALQEIITAIGMTVVRTLVIEADRIIPGFIDENLVLTLDESGPDVLNTMAAYALTHHVEVIILPKEKMPTHKGAFALIR